MDSHDNVPSMIPGRELTGSRREKLAQLDALIADLEQLRRRLTGISDVPRGEGFEGPSRLIGAPEWPWFASGVALGALFVVLLLVARSCAS
jgi:hypothetical protein